MTHEEFVKDYLRSVLDPPLERLCDPEYLVTRVLTGDAGSNTMAWVSRAIEIRLMREMASLGSRVEAVIQSTSDATSKLQEIANRLTRWILVLTIMMSVLAFVQAWPLLVKLLD